VHIREKRLTFVEREELDFHFHPQNAVSKSTGSSTQYVQFRSLCIYLDKIHELDTRIGERFVQGSSHDRLGTQDIHTLLPWANARAQAFEEVLIRRVHGAATRIARVVECYSRVRAIQSPRDKNLVVTRQTAEPFAFVRVGLKADKGDPRAKLQPLARPPPARSDIDDSQSLTFQQSVDERR
jgi:hypothetical protein